MRYLKITSAENPSNDFIELNNFNGFLCTQFQTLGFSRKYENIEVGNRRFVTYNKPEFKEYTLTIEILTKYSLYETKYKELTTFLDRNKKSGFRLYYRPYDDMDMHYILCDVVSISKIDKLQPITLVVTQNSLWLGEDEKVETQQIVDNIDNVFAFAESSEYGDRYFSAKFKLDDKNSDYYCIAFYSNASSIAAFEINSYSEIPLNLIIYGFCEKPYVALFKEGENIPIREIEIDETINNNNYVYINSHIGENGVFLVDEKTEVRTPIENKILNERGSPYWFIDKGRYYIKIQDNGQNICQANLLYNEEFNE